MKRPLVLGKVTGFDSYPVVLKGILRAMCYHGLEPVVADTGYMGGGIHANGELEDQPITWLESKVTADLTSGILPLVDHDKMLFCLNPTVTLAKGVVEAGYKLVGMHVGDVDKVPLNWLEVMKRETLIVTPSGWMTSVITEGLKGNSWAILMANHGVGPAFEPVEPLDDLPNCDLQFLHCCTSMYFPERKGTPQVVEAFVDLVKDLPGCVRLMLVFPKLTKPIRKLLSTIPKDIWPLIDVVLHPDGKPADYMAQLYSTVDVVVCPSRAEGFGMQPLEARACGTPVIQTFVTGMSSHLSKAIDTKDFRGWGVLPVPTGPWERAWGDFGNAPTVAPADVAVAMRAAWEDLTCLTMNADDHADEVREAWRWESTCAELCKWIEGQ
jgi:hypothetical protein